MNSERRASRVEIFTHLRRLLGEEAVSLAQEVAILATSGNTSQALEILRSYDRELGGIASEFTEEKGPGVYRPICYVYYLCFSPTPHHFGRQIIISACAYLEELLKRMVTVGILGLGIPVRRFPLGKLVKKLRQRLAGKIPKYLLDELDWLAQGVYNFAKHQYNFDDWEEPPEHYFGLDEAIAVYLIVRKLGLELESLSGIPERTLLRE